ncbi:MAG: pyruvate kinase [Chloroflexota bacterium]|nr:pyruvate kinase [Chloroflexota bacterium]
MSTSVGALIRQLSAIREVLVAAETLWHESLRGVPETHRQSARNLLHYLALRRQDMRPLQEELAELGLSSLGRSEAHVLASVDAVLHVLHRLGRRQWRSPNDPGTGFAAGDALLKRHTQALLGPEPAARDARIMVTMPAEAATDFELVRALLAGGMDCMRINCAHDDAVAWTAMIANLRRAEQELGSSCRVLMDLAGPKLRTGPLEPGPQVVKVRPQRDSHGRVTAPARIWLTGIANPAPAPAPAAATLPVPDQWLAALRPGDEVAFTDARESRRILTISAEERNEERNKERDADVPGRWAESRKTAYIATGTRLWVKDASSKDRSGKDHRRAGKGSGKGGKRDAAHQVRPVAVGQLPPIEQSLLLKPGDTLVLTRELRPGKPASFSSDGRLASPATIGCTLPEVFAAARAGQSIWLDDGKIGG